MADFYLKNGNLYGWGSNAFGQLGDGTTVDKLNPTKIGILKWKSINRGILSTLGITESGDLYAWGQNGNGQLGDGTTVDKLVPTKIGDMKWKNVSIGNNHTLGITESGDLYAWGINTYGQLGDGTKVKKLVPTKIGDLKWKNVSIGNIHSIGVTESGDLYAWGQNGNGQLGDGTKIDKLVPTKIGDLKWKSVSVGTYHSIGVTESGDLYGWGNNGNGQIGDGTTIQRLVPTKTKIGDLKWKSVSSKESVSGGVTESGDLYTWGFNAQGQIGDGTTVDKLIPTKIGILKWKIFSMGNNYSFGITENSDLYTWGHNENGQLGDGTKISKLVPTFIRNIYEKATLLKLKNKVYSLKSEDALQSAMTSNTVPAPYVASSSANNTTTIFPYMAFDKSPEKYWASATIVAPASPRIQIDFGSSKKVSHLVITARNGSTSSIMASSPKDFYVEGSNDNTTFTKILDVKDEVDWKPLEKRVFTLDKVVNYRHYRMFTTATNGINYLSIGELEYKNIELTEIPDASLANLIEYGSSDMKDFGYVLQNKSYVLQDGKSEDADGLRKQELSIKPLSIKFE